MNYYFLNSKGKQAIKRILCVYEYHYPQVTFNPGLVSISSLLLHYMQEHEVFAALCFMSSTKEHLIESKASWDTTCSVFTRLLKNYCVNINFFLNKKGFFKFLHSKKVFIKLILKMNLFRKKTFLLDLTDFEIYFTQNYSLENLIEDKREKFI